MHFHFSEIEVIWTLTFAALLVLLVVLLGRDRVRRYPFFTAGVVLAALEMLVRRLLAQKLAPLDAAELIFALGDLGVLITLLVAIELARRAFPRASRLSSIVGTVVVIAVAAATVAWWGPWPAHQTLLAHSRLAHIRLMQLFAEKGDLFNNLAFIALTLIAVFTGRRFHAGWRSHARQLLLGYSVAALAQVAVRQTWQKLARAPQPHTQAEFNHQIAIQTRLLNANSLVYLVVAIAWIACLWFDDPGCTPAVNPASSHDAPPADAAPPESGSEEKPDPVAAALQRALGPDAGIGTKRNAGKPPSSR
jgi:hypothetical protein